MVAPPQKSNCEYAYRRRSGKLKRTEILVILLILPAIVGVLVFVGIDHRPRGRLECKNNLKIIVLALRHYESIHGRLPPAYIADENGKPMHSWRVLILPALDSSELYKQYRFDEPWNGPNNRLLLSKMPRVYQCPDSDADQEDGMTQYVLLRGPQTAFPGESRVRLNDITDGQDVTLAVVEHPGRAVPWLKPDDVTPEEFIAAVTAQESGGHHKGVTHVAMASGSVKTLSFDISRRILRALTTINGGESVGEDDF